MELCTDIPCLMTEFMPKTWYLNEELYTVCTLQYSQQNYSG